MGWLPPAKPDTFSFPPQRMLLSLVSFHNLYSIYSREWMFQTKPCFLSLTFSLPTYPSRRPLNQSLKRSASYMSPANPDPMPFLPPYSSTAILFRNTRHWWAMLELSPLIWGPCQVLHHRLELLWRWTGTEIDLIQGLPIVSINLPPSLGSLWSPATHHTRPYNQPHK